MSFSSLQKDEMIDKPPRSACCRRAFLSGVMAARARITETGVAVSVDSYKNAEFVATLVAEVYGKEPTIKSFGGRRVEVNFNSKAARSKLSSFTTYLAFKERRCSGCDAAFLRGIFFAAGKLTDPASQYNLEFSPSGNAEALCELFSEMHLSPKVRDKSGQKTVYFRNSGEIEDFLARAAMNDTAFIIMNVKIKNDIRNNVNRFVNCNQKNTGRLRDAAEDVNKCIKYLMKYDLISLLPEELEATARLRYENPELSLANLAALHTPPISKPGLSHRLKRIEEMTAEAKKKRSKERSAKKCD